MTQSGKTKKACHHGGPSPYVKKMCHSKLIVARRLSPKAIDSTFLLYGLSFPLGLGQLLVVGEHNQLARQLYEYQSSGQNSPFISCDIPSSLNVAVIFSHK